MHDRDDTFPKCNVSRYLCASTSKVIEHINSYYVYCNTQTCDLTVYGTLHAWCSACNDTHIPGKVYVRK